MSVELMSSVPPPPPPPPVPQFNGTMNGGRRPNTTTTTIHNNKPAPLVNFQTNGNTNNNNFSILCDEIKNGVKLKKCPVNSEAIAKTEYVVNNDSRHTRSNSFDENSDNQVCGDNKDPKMVSVQAELIRRLRRRNEGIDDENQEQKILSPTLAMFVQNKTKPLKRDEAQEENSPKMITHGKRSFTVNRKHYSNNGAASSLQSSPNSSEMDLSSDKSLSHTDLTGKLKMSNGGSMEKLKPTEIYIAPEHIDVKPPPLPVTPAPEPAVSKIFKEFVKNSSPMPFVVETTTPLNYAEVIKPLNITISSSTNQTTKLSPQLNGHHSPIPSKSPTISMKSPKLSSKSPPISSIEYIPAEEKASKKVSELCKTYSAADNNNTTTKVNDNFVHLNGNVTLKRPKQLPQTNQKISHGKPNYRTQSSTTLSHQHVIAPPKSPVVIHKTEVNIQPTIVPNEQQKIAITTTTSNNQQQKTSNFISFSKELSSSPNRYTDQVVTTTPKSDAATIKRATSNILADLQQKQFIKDLIVDDLLEVKDIQFSIDPEKNDITIDLKIGMHLNARNLN